MQVYSYNCRGLRLGNSIEDKARRSVVDNLLSHCDVLCLQETFLSKQELGGLSSFNDSFLGAGESTTDLSLRALRGRIPGGVAILWHKRLDPLITVIRLDVDWCIGVQFKINNREFVILNVYTPFESRHNEDEFLNRLGFINSFISDHPSSCIFIVGDMNSDLSDNNSMFAKHIVQFCEDNNLILSSQLLLPSNSFSYISEAWNSTSWLDHCISTADAHASISSMEIVYDAAFYDHVPVGMTIECESLPEVTQQVESTSTPKLDWSKLSDEEVLLFYGRADRLLNEVFLPKDAILCCNVNCNLSVHNMELCTMYNSIVGALLEASKPCCSQHKDNGHKNKPGWNIHVAGHHTVAKEAHKAWILAGKPKEGPILDEKKRTNSIFKNAVRYIGKHEQSLRADSMAAKLLGKDVTGFWKEVRALNRNKTALPNSIDGVSGEPNIAELWKQHYSEMFYYVSSESYNVGNLDSTAPVGISVCEVYDAIGQLADNKSCGPDHISSEHLKLAGPRVAALLAICLSGFLSHGFLPDSMLAVTLVPVIKDKTGKVGSLDNYRPIALASVISKVLEKVILQRLTPFFNTAPNQFGFKPKHSTDLCIYALKDVVDMYRGANSSVLVGFIDASKAFDRVNHFKLFTKLKQRGVPEVYTRVLAFWYANQSVRVKWGGTVSTPFSVGNGVRQGGLLSPALFNLYMDDLSVQLSHCKTGCFIGDKLINHLMYADDLAIVSPSSAGFQQLLNICTAYGLQFDVKYNAKKSAVLICRSRADEHLSFPSFYLSGQVISVTSKIKYLGHIITDKLLDDDDMLRQRRMLYAQANMLARKFYWCSTAVKINLFKTYCTPLYTAPLWVYYKKASFNKLKVAYNDSLRILLRKPRWTSASELFCQSRISSFEALLRNLMYKFICRLNHSQNTIIKAIADPRCSMMRYVSYYWQHWYKSL